MADEKAAPKIMEVGVVFNNKTGEFAGAVRHPNGRIMPAPWRTTEAEATADAERMGQRLAEALREAGAKVTAVRSSDTVH